MTASTDFLPFATGVGANVESQASYATDPSTSGGFSAGIASSAKFNKAMRQATFVAAAMATWMSQELAANIADDGNLANFVTEFQNALSTYLSSGNYLQKIVKYGTLTLPASGAATASISGSFASAFPNACDHVDVVSQGQVNSSGGGQPILGCTWTASGLTVNADTNTGQLGVGAGRLVFNQTVTIAYRAEGH